MGSPFGDWAHFWSLAHRVQFLAHYETNSPYRHSAVIDSTSLVQLFPHLPPEASGCLLPNLRQLHYGADGDYIVYHLLPFFSPKLARLELNLGSTSIGAVGAALSNLVSARHGTLRNLHISGQRVWDAACVQRLSHLLKEEPNLEILELRVDTSEGDILPGFESCQNLRELAVTTWAEPTHFLESLVTSCPALEKLHILLRGWEVQNETIAPLLRLTTLTDLKVEAEVYIGLDQRDIYDMGKAWSRMTSLSLTSYIPMTLLSSFAEAFSERLERLDLAVAYEECPPATPDLPRFRRLEALMLRRTVVPDDKVVAVAEYLSTVCPGVKLNLEVPYSPSLVLVSQVMGMVERIRVCDEARSTADR